MSCVTEDRFLEGNCLEFAQQKADELGENAEIISVYEDGYPFHVAVKHDGLTIDATGEWNSEDEYLDNLRGEMKRLFPESEWDGMFWTKSGVAKELRRGQ